MAIELPKDADGREIPLDTTVLYDKDGNEMCVKRIEFDPFKKEWSFAIRKGPPGGMVVYRRPRVVYLEKAAPPDSWEKLLEDLNEAGDARYDEACAYFHRDRDEDGCISCPGGEDGCARIAMRDIASRIRKLRGED